MAMKMAEFVPFVRKTKGSYFKVRNAYQGNDALVMHDGSTDILQYMEELLIVKYECNEKRYYPEPCENLNHFVHSITVSDVSGKRISVPVESACDEEIVQKNTVWVVEAYYEDDIGVKHRILQSSICEMLKQSPDLVVSPEGMLVFFTKKEMLATLDCGHYCFIDLNLKGRTIEKVEVCDDFCKIILSDDTNFKLTFDFNFITKPMICPKLEEVKAEEELERLLAKLKKKQCKNTLNARVDEDMHETIVYLEKLRDKILKPKSDLENK